MPGVINRVSDHQRRKSLITKFLLISQDRLVLDTRGSGLRAFPELEFSRLSRAGESDVGSAVTAYAKVWIRLLKISPDFKSSS